MSYFQPRLWPQSIKKIIPGILLCASVTLLAKVLTDHYAMPVMLMSLFLGLALHFTIKKPVFEAGIQTCSKQLLKIGVILLGARIMFSDIFALGYVPLITTITGCIAVISISIFASKMLKCDTSLGVLIGGATAICGASAAIALSTVLPKNKNLEKNTLFAVIGATAIGTCAMIIYPVILHWDWVSLEPSQAGFLIGGTIHDVSQVVGAGYSISNETGDQAILVKLTRVFMLAPVILFFMFCHRNDLEQTKKPEFPYFLVAFLALVTLNSFGLITQELAQILNQSSKWLLIMGITAVGIKTSLEKLFTIGWKPFLLLLINVVVISSIYICTLYLGWY